MEKGERMRRSGAWRWTGLAVLWAVAAWAQGAPAEVGQWSAEEQWPLTVTHAHTLPTGKVMFMGEFDQGTAPPYLWDPATDQLTALSRPPYNIFCAGESFLEDGTLLLTGGHDMQDVGLPYATLFNPFTGAWTQLPDMNDRRWYPTTVTLPDGRGLTLSGETDGAGTSDGLPQIWDPPSGAWVNLTNAWLHLPYYPRTFVAPNGRLFVAGPQALARWLDTAGGGAWVNGPRTVSPVSRTYGTSVMYEPGKVLVVGGGQPPLASAEVIDLTDPAPVWRDTDPMHFARRQLNATLLPDGRVLVTGGSSGATFDDVTAPVLASEVWDPQTGHWTQWASQASYHGYHSTAVLLPDGRVLMGGGRKTQTVQIFSPPYLFQGARPALSSAPDTVLPGQRFFVGTPDGAGIAQVTWVRLSAVTHAYNMNQRFNRLSFSQADGGLSVTAPPDNDVAPPGHYLLFLIDAKGVPSVGRVIQLGRAADPFSHPVVFSDPWRYDDSGVEPDAAWRSASFDDSGWKRGAGQLGYGEGDEATAVENHGPTLYLRRSFTLRGPVTAARMDVVLGDGATVWLNGVQVFTQNMANGTGVALAASARASNRFVRVALPTAPFVEGANTLAVEVKRVAAASPVLSFALSLDVRGEDAPTAALKVTAPNGGERFVAGEAIHLAWTTTGEVPRVDLSYSLDSGGQWTPLASGLSNGGAYDWTAPQVSLATARIRVASAADPSLADASDGDFSIAPDGAAQGCEACGADAGTYAPSAPGSRADPSGCEATGAAPLLGWLALLAACVLWRRASRRRI